jgi:hypothetical protein
MAQEGPLVIWTDTSDETSVRMLHARAIEQPFSDVLVHTLEVCKGAHLYDGYPASKDETTHGECVQSL